MKKIGLFRFCFIFLVLAFFSSIAFAQPTNCTDCMWVADNDDYIYMIDISAPTTILEAWDTGTSTPFGVEYYGGSIYYVDYGTDTIYKMSLQGASENSWALAVAGDAYTLCANDTHFFIFDVKDSPGGYITTIADPSTLADTWSIDEVEGCFWRNDTKHLFTVETGDWVREWDNNGNEIGGGYEQHVDIGAPTAIVWDGTYWYISDDGDDVVYRMTDAQMKAGTYTDTFDPPGGQPQGLSYLYVAAVAEDHSRNVTDLFFTSDLDEKQAGYERDCTDTFELSKIESKRFDGIRIVVDLYESSDLDEKQVEFNRFVIDFSWLSDWLEYDKSGVNNYEETVFDSFLSSIGLDRTAEFNRDFFDSFVFSQILDPTANFFRGIIDAFENSDLFTRRIAFTRSIDDSFVYSQILDPAANFFRAIFDALGISDYIFTPVEEEFSIIIWLEEANFTSLTFNWSINSSTPITIGSILLIENSTGTVIRQIDNPGLSEDDSYTFTFLNFGNTYNIWLNVTNEDSEYIEGTQEGETPLNERNMEIWLFIGLFVAALFLAFVYFYYDVVYFGVLSAIMFILIGVFLATTGVIVQLDCFSKEVIETTVGNVTSTNYQIVCSEVSLDLLRDFMNAMGLILMFVGAGMIVDFGFRANAKIRGGGG